MVSLYKTRCFINGKFVDPIKGGQFDTLNPATGQVICSVARGTKEDIDAAVQAAKVCLNGPNWGYKSTGV